MEKLDGRFAFMMPILFNKENLTVYCVGGDNRLMNEDDYYALPEFSEPVWSRHGISGRYMLTEFIAEGESLQFPGDNYTANSNLENICIQKIFNFLNKSSYEYMNLYTSQNCPGFGKYDLSELIIKKMIGICKSHKKNIFTEENIIKEQLEFLLLPKFSNELNNLFHATELETKAREDLIAEYACKIEAECMQNKRELLEIDNIIKTEVEKSFTKWDLPIKVTSI